MAGQFVLVSRSSLKCAHLGSVDLDPSQHWVKIDGAEVLVDPDTVDRPISGCAMATPANPPCTRTITADRAASFSGLVKIDGKGVCLATATGMTNWSQLAVVPYVVASPAQDFVAIGGG